MDNYNTQNAYSSTEPNNSQKDSERKIRNQSHLGAGMVIGIMGTILVLMLVIGIGCRVTGTKILLTKGNAVTAHSEGELLDEKTVNKIDELASYMSLYYYEDIEETQLQDGLYSGLLEGLGDPYSVYYNAEEYAAMQVTTTGKYYGIGAGLTQDPDTMVVSITKIYEGTPSEEAGLLAEDVILSVDGTDATTMEVTELVKLIRGEAGTKVHLEIYRPSTDESLSFDVERKDVTLPSISYELLDHNIGYILIDSFETDTANQFESAIASLQEEGMTSLILDVRYNPGGMVTSVVQILDDILPEGTVVYTEDKYGKRETYSSDGKNYLDCPIVVLINGDSASAAEILAGAIKDYHYGTLIGTTTYGKGIVQTIFPLEDGDAVKITTAKYYTPNGNYIHGVGISPDIELEYEYLNPEGESYEMIYDNQIQKAIEVLTNE